MNFTDEGYIINCRRHGEKSLILTVLCKEYGKVCGYVKSGINKKNLAVGQQGNLVKIDAWSRVDDNMLLEDKSTADIVSIDVKREEESA